MAYKWIPVPESIDTMLKTPKHLVDLSESLPVIESILGGNRTDLPTKLDQLSGLKSTGSWLTRKVAAEMGYLVGSVSGNYSHSTYVQQLSAWKDVRNDKGAEAVRYGISVRYLVTVEEIKAGAKLNNIGGLAASASYDTVKASVEFSTLGVPASWLIGMLPTGGTFDLNKFVEFEGALKGVRKALEDNVSKDLLPQILEVKTNVKDEDIDEYEDAIAVSYALSCIGAGWSLSEALRNHNQSSQTFRSTVETIYTKEATITNENEKPSNKVVAEINKSLNGLSMV